MGSDRLSDLRGTYQVRAHQVVPASAAAFAGLDVVRCFGFDVLEPEPVRRRKIPGGTVKIVFALEGTFEGRSLDPTALTQHPQRDMCRLAGDFGYYDQSHLIRDFRRFAGAPPGRLLG